MQLKIAAMSLLSSIALSACSVVGIRAGTEEPRYTVLETQGPLQIRQYDARLAAETAVTGSEYAARGAGFRTLARYIFGANTSKGGIAMTAPVAQAGGAHSNAEKIDITAPVRQDQSAPGIWRIRFFMPAEYTEATLPRPDDPAVKIVAIPAETYAVYRYTGSTDPAATSAADRQLLEHLERSRWVSTAPPVAWFYDPPWTLPFLRRNEAAVLVTKKPT